MLKSSAGVLGMHSLYVLRGVDLGRRSERFWLRAQGD